MIGQCFRCSDKPGGSHPLLQLLAHRIPDSVDVVYICFSSQAYSEEQIDPKRLRNWLDHFGMKFVGDPEGGEEGLHASGHASGPDLLRIVRGIKPKVLIPIHTLDPGYFAAHLEGEDIEVHIPKLGEKTRLAS